MRQLDGIEKEYRKKKLPVFDIGDTVDVHVKIIEGERERVQLFSGTVIARRHQGLGETFTVRRLVQGEGVERVFPIQSPRVVKVEVKKRGKVRRAKLNYIRDRVGRATRIEERLSGRIQKAPKRVEAAPEKKAEAPTSGKKPKVAPAKEKAETTKK